MDNLLDIALEISDKEEKRIAKRKIINNEVLLVRLTNGSIEYILPENMSRIRFDKIKEDNIELVNKFKMGNNMHLKI